MSLLRFDIDEETNKKLMLIKGGRLKVSFAKELFKKAVEAEYKRQQKKRS